MTEAFKSHTIVVTPTCDTKTIRIDLPVYEEGDLTPLIERLRKLKSPYVYPPYGGSPRPLEQLKHAVAHAENALDDVRSQLREALEELSLIRGIVEQKCLELNEKGVPPQKENLSYVPLGQLVEHTFARLEKGRTDERCPEQCDAVFHAPSEGSPETRTIPCVLVKGHGGRHEAEKGELAWVDAANGVSVFSGSYRR